VSCGGCQRLRRVLGLRSLDPAPERREHDPASEFFLAIARVALAFTVLRLGAFIAGAA